MRRETALFKKNKRAGGQPHAPMGSGASKAGVSAPLNGSPQATVAQGQQTPLTPPQAEGRYFQLGESYRRAGQLEQALEAYLMEFRLNPGHWQTLGALGQTLTQLCRYPEALDAFSLALKAAPTPLDNLNNLFHLGQLYKIIRNFEPAVDCYDYVLKMQPHHSGALIALSQVYRQLGETEKAIEIYDRMLVLQPDDPSLLISKALSLPVLYQSNQSLQAWRQTVERQFDALLTTETFENRGLALHGSTFYLAYQGMNDRALAIKVGQVFQKLMPPSPALNPRVQGKPRIGIISRFLTPTHTVGRFMQGIIQHLSREKFQVTTFSVGRDNAYLPSGEEHPEDAFVVLPVDNIEAMAQQIIAHRPDILFYADLGMNVTTYCLAGMRLAPVQCVTWGHPVTTGLSTIDYFISSKRIEPENAQDHYSESLVLLENLPTYYYRPTVDHLAGNLALFGFREQSNLYLCPQSLFKFHPDFDPILAAILRQDTQGELILLSHYTEAVNRQLRARFAATMPDVADRIHFMPRLDREQFLQLLSCATVMLDPVHFGGGNTTYEALALGVPIVTWPSPYMRGRVTAACYQRMGLPELIAHNAEEYIALAVHLGSDPAARAQAHEQILSKNTVLYEDAQVIEELEAFFLDALAHHQGDLTHG
jgi:protein O-GlcNAc transferase